MYTNYYDHQTQSLLFGQPVESPPELRGRVTHKGKEYSITSCHNFAAENNPDLWAAFIQPVLSELPESSPIKPGDEVIIKHIPNAIYGEISHRGFNISGKRARIIRVADKFECRLKPEFGMSVDEVREIFALDRKQFDLACNT